MQLYNSSSLKIKSQTSTWVNPWKPEYPSSTQTQHRRLWPYFSWPTNVLLMNFMEQVIKIIVKVYCKSFQNYSERTQFFQNYMKCYSQHGDVSWCQKLFSLLHSKQLHCCLHCPEALAILIGTFWLTPYSPDLTPIYFCIFLPVQKWLNSLGRARNWKRQYWISWNPR